MEMKQMDGHLAIGKIHSIHACKIKRCSHPFPPFPTFLLRFSISSFLLTGNHRHIRHKPSAYDNQYVLLALHCDRNLPFELPPFDR